MRDNTPPRVPDINHDDEDELVEEIIDDEIDNVFDEELEMEEVTLAELEQRLASYSDDEDEFDGEEEIRIQSIHDDAKLTFHGHNSPIFSCCLHPQQPWAATGSQDDRALVWDINTGETLHEFTNHKETVNSVQFNHDGNYFVTGDLGGEIFVYKVVENPNEKPTFTKVWEYGMGEMSWLYWHRGANVLLAGSDTGEIYVWRIPTGDCKILPGHGERCETAELAYDGKKLLAAYNGGSVKLWNLKTCLTIMEISPMDQPLCLQSSCFAVACHREEPIYACGDTLGTLIICTNNGASGANNKADCNIECLAFSPSSDTHLLASGTLEGQIAIWDYSKNLLRTLCDNPSDDGIVRIKWINDHTLIVATQQGNIHGFDARSGIRKFTLTGHHYAIYEMVYKPENNTLLTISEDATAKIFNIPD